MWSKRKIIFVFCSVICVTFGQIELNPSKHENIVNFLIETESQMDITLQAMKDYIDDSINPCEDFYQYACGNWKSRNANPNRLSQTENYNTIFKLLSDNVKRIHKLLANEKNTTQVSEATTKAIDFYHSCLTANLTKYTAVESVIKYINDFTTWPLITSNWSADSFDWVALSAKFHQFGSNVFLMLATIRHPNDATLNIPYFRPRKNISLQNLRNIMEGVLNSMNFTVEENTEFLNDTLEFASKLPTGQNRRELTTTIEDLSKRIPGINWKHYLEVAYDREFQNDDLVAITSLDYYEKLAQLVSETPPKTIANHMMIMFVGSFYKYFTSQFPKGSAESTESFQSRIPTYCTLTSKNLLGMAVGSMFVREYFDQAARDDVNRLTEKLRDSFHEIINGTEWLDEKSRENALAKLSSMKFHIGYEDIIDNFTQLDAFYQDVQVDRDDFYTNCLNLIKTETKRKLFTPRDPVFIHRPADADARHGYVSNTLVISAGMCQAPFYNRNFPKFLKYGGLGSFISHEIVHGFDGAENFTNWWTNNTKDVFQQRLTCFLNQHQNFTLSERFSKAENIADNGGLRIGFKAYQQWLKENGDRNEVLPGSDFTPKQLFFLTFAQNWCADNTRQGSVSREEAIHGSKRFRVINPLSNNEDFAREFNCARGTPMSPVTESDKCRIW